MAYSKLTVAPSERPGAEAAALRRGSVTPIIAVGNTRMANEQISRDMVRTPSESGETPPYRVPAGVVGLPGSSLRDNAHVSAPELNRPPVADGSGENAVAAAYVEVRDRCEQLVPAEACRALRSQLDDNLARQRGATRDERAGLAGEARKLADKLAGC